MQENDSSRKIMYTNALDHMNNHELDVSITRFGAFLSVIQTKKISPAGLLLYLVENRDITSIFLKVTGIDTFEQLVRELMVRFPILYESKVISTKIHKINANKKTTNNI